MQRAFAEHNESAEEPIQARVGLNAGEPIAEEDDPYGTAVNLAARIAAKAIGGEVLASDLVRALVAGRDFVFADRGRRKLKGFEKPVRLFEVRWREEGWAAFTREANLHDSLWCLLGHTSLQATSVYVSLARDLMDQ